MATSSSKSSSSGSANKLQSIQKALHDFLHTPSAATPIFELVEKNAKIKREYLFLGAYQRPPSLFPSPAPDKRPAERFLRGRGSV
jgi:hypothetical protein